MDVFELDWPEMEMDHERCRNLCPAMGQTVMP